ncbi:NADH-quinone oxidoreductase subunit N [Vreelandella sulfidaeris]|jgi:NADH-quinone oxidoreductase subunit N|uniref:NADH-quinone oxidoreductase subunit N n=4 Tax=Vreelandella TaxID=3137766 RepID=A0A365TI39_9GAMM|nr:MULTISPECIES: NADH-quinone oxidoreductase subunit N [Halomonas]NVF16309.1 NADH-quinone oxidoreductase subunit N [Halomonas maris]NYS80060.1 NADH-quinone oxidoreductase subunit N [Halomonas glaciei]RBI65165.1 NADH-quinone oxidoreductase subunit N [Halomonas sulfidaeris]|tara:strand:+ start:5723 stop:7132 length:1410 start_codon:yes stop_codon:yes gene_type:complete
MPIGDVLPEISLTLGAVIIVLFAAFARQHQHVWAAVLALLTIGLCIGLTFTQWDGPPRLTFSGVWALDGMALSSKLVVLIAGALVIAMSPEWMQTDRRHAEYYALMLFALLGVIMMASASDTMELVVGVLLSSVASYPLAAYHRTWAPALEAGMKYFLMGALTNTLLTIGVVVLFGLTGNTGYPEIAQKLSVGHDSLALTIATASIILGLSFKLAAFPAHAWMPDVAQGSPAPVAAFLTVIPKIGAAVALARFVSLMPPDVAWRAIVALISVTTMTLGNVAALRQTDVRRLLGWSSVSQSGYALMAIVVMGTSDQALPALVFFLASYAIANLAAFAVVTYLRGRTALESYQGLARQAPIATTILIASLLSLVGIPPLIGFFGKLMLFSVTIEGGYAWLAFVAAANTVVSLFYYLRIVARMMFSDTRPTVHVLVGQWARTTMIVSGLLLIVGGLGAEMLMEFTDSIGFVR